MADHDRAEHCRPVDLSTREPTGANWHEVLHAADIREARVHDARHTAATLLLEQGIAYVLGSPGPHASIEFSVHPRGIGYGGQRPRPDFDARSLTSDEITRNVKRRVMTGLPVHVS